MGCQCCVSETGQTTQGLKGISKKQTKNEANISAVMGKKEDPRSNTNKQRDYSDN